MGKKTDPEVNLGKQDRFYCERCKTTKGSDRTWVQCPTCGDQMMRLKEWVRKQARK